MATIRSATPSRSRATRLFNVGTASQTDTVTGVIADNGTPGILEKTGAGTLVLNPLSAGKATSNSYTGGTIIDAGTLDLGSAGAAGSGAITFAAGSTGELAFAPGVAPTNTIDGFLIGAGAIDVLVSGSVTATITAGNKLVITDTAGTQTLSLDPTHNYSDSVAVVNGEPGWQRLVDQPRFSPAGALVAVADARRERGSDSDRHPDTHGPEFRGLAADLYGRRVADGRRRDPGGRHHRGDLRRGLDPGATDRARIHADPQCLRCELDFHLFGRRSVQQRRRRNRDAGDRARHRQSGHLPGVPDGRRECRGGDDRLHGAERSELRGVAAQLQDRRCPPTGA